jgi:hypothetical protein
MATVSRNPQLDLGLDLAPPRRAFSDAEREQMRRDDIAAGITIALILTGMIAAGVALILIGVAFSFSL